MTRTAQKTTGQEFTAALRKLTKVGPRTRRIRVVRKIRRDVRRQILDDAFDVSVYPGCYSEDVRAALSSGWAALRGWVKHVEGHRLNGTQTAYLKSLTPWQFTALLGDMVDAQISNVGEAERWFRARQDADIAAWNAKTAA